MVRRKLSKDEADALFESLRDRLVSDELSAGHQAQTEKRDPFYAQPYEIPVRYEEKQLPPDGDERELGKAS